MLRRRRPTVPKLVRKNNVKRLVAALDYRDHFFDREGRVYDLGMPVRRDAALALMSVGDTGDVDIVRALIQALGDSSGEVRRAAASALGARGDPTAALPLADAALSWEEPRYGAARVAAAEALIALSAPDTIEVVVNDVIDRRFDTEQGGKLVKRMADRGGEETARRASAAAAVALARGCRDVTERASEMLVLLGANSVEPLLKLLAEPGGVRTAAISALGRIGDLRASGPLVRLLFDDDAAVRAAVANALGQIADPTAVQPLLKATGDRDHTVRGAALEALNRLGPLATVSNSERHEASAPRQLRPADRGIRRSRASWFRG